MTGLTNSKKVFKKNASDLVNYAFVGSMKRYFTWGRFLEMEHSILQYSIQRLPVTQTSYSLLFLFSASLSCISGNCRCLDGGVTCRYNIYILGWAWSTLQSSQEIV